MRRKALIIGNSGGEKNLEDYLEGVQQDVKNYRQFLLSNIGGKWYEDEIEVSLDEAKSQVVSKITAIKNSHCDFVFILFSGHGSYSSLKECRKLYIFNDSIYENELTHLAPKQITILDTCANIEKEEILTEGMESLTFAKMLIDYRKNYENAIARCLEQQVILYSSSIDESSRDSELGGLFAHNLLKVAYNNRKDILSSREAYLSAKEAVQKKTKMTQNPSSDLIKSYNILPFSLGE